MKKLFAALVTAALFLVPMSAIAAVKSGDTCKKVGTTATANGKKFTCVKSGKKFVWNKGVAIPKPRPSTTSSPSSSPSTVPTVAPTPTPTPTPVLAPLVDQNRGYLKNGLFVYRVVDDVLQRRIYGTEDYTVIDTRTESDFDAIRVKAYKEIWGLTKSPGHPNIDLIYTISESYPKEHADAVKRGVKLASEMFNSIFDEKFKVAVTLVTEKDAEFIKNNIGALSRPDEVGGTLGNIDRYTPDSVGVGSGAAGFNRGGRGFIGGFYIGTFRSFLGIDYLWPEIATHEMSHILQTYFATKRDFNSESDWNKAVPVNFLEGSANTIGHALAVQNLGWYSDESDLTIKRYASRINVNNRMETEAEVLEMLERTKTRTDSSYGEMAYPVGQVLWEYIIGTYGFDAYVKFLKNIPVLPSYEDNLKSVTGLSKIELYKSAAPYMISVWKRALALPNK
jgi:hypothetical protein